MNRLRFRPTVSALLRLVSVAIAHRRRDAAIACQDLTAIKLAELRFRPLFEEASYPIVVIAPTGVIMLSNARAQSMFGFKASELAGRHIDQLVAPPDRNPSTWWHGAGGDGVHPDVQLWARRRDGAEFPAEVSLIPLETDEGVLVSAAIRDVTLLHRAAEALVHQARHDPMTGLPNRLMFLERLDQALARARRSARTLAVVFIDLDDFKEVNDTRGHDAGDVLLTALTGRLSEVVRDGDTLARLGGDEFVVLCEDLDDEDEAIGIAERLATVAFEPVVIAGHEHAVSISAGVVMVTDSPDATAGDLLRDADAAMYAAKARGKGRVAVFDNVMRERRSQRTATESLLRGALVRGELELRYQPVVDLEHERVVSAEALLRWRHPLRGLLVPGDFIAVAESTGLIAEIGAWVIGEACRQAAAWRDEAGIAEPVPVSVNVSAYQLRRGDLVGAVGRALNDTGLEPSLLAIEVTEGTLLEDVVRAGRELRSLKQLGVRLVVDDFGIGYSSLPALRHLSIDGLKLDRSVVQSPDSGPGDGALIEAVVNMAAAIDAVVTAEGVETVEQAAWLREHGCDYAQGHLFARPLQAAELTRMLVLDGDGAGASVL